jgi:hypothetical protein
VVDIFSQVTMEQTASSREWNYIDTQLKNPSVGCNLQACEEFETTILEEKPILHVVWDS